MEERRFRPRADGVARIPCRVCFRPVELHPDFVAPAGDKWVMTCPECKATFPVRVDDSFVGFARRHGVEMTSTSGGPPAVAGRATMRILVADDEPSIQQFLAALLELEDVEIVGYAADGHEVLAQMEATRPDVVVLDLMMPGMSGLDVLPLLRERHPGVRVVAVSAMPEHTAEHDALAAGADAFVSKLDVASRLAAALGIRTPDRTPSA